MINSTLYKYYRYLNINIRNDLLLEQLGNKIVFVLITDHTFYIYDLERLNLLFIGPYIKEIEKVFFNRDCLYLTYGKNVSLYKRGIIIDKFQFENKIKDLYFVGNALFIIFNDLVKLYESDIFFNASFIFHPKTYINKLIILQDNKVLLYNFIKNKIIYEFKNIRSDFIKMYNTKILDIISVVYKNKIDIVNLKLDSVLFSLNLNYTSFINIDFSDDKMLVVVDNTLIIYDLIYKQEILQKQYILNCRFIDNQYVLLITKTNISIYEICNKKLNIIKDKIIFMNNIQNFIFYLSKNIVLANNNEILRYDLYNDNNYAKLTYDKTDDKNLCKFLASGSNIVIYKNFNLIKIDLLNKRSDFILREKFEHISLNNDRVLVLTNCLYAINIKSKLIHFKIDKYYENFIFMDNNIISYKEKNIYIYNLKMKKEFTVNIKSFIELIKVKDNIIMVKTSENLFFYNITNLLRKFTLSNIIDWDINNKMLCVLCTNSIYIYDLLSNIILDKIIINCTFKFIRFSNDNFFILLVNEKDEIVMLCRKLYETTYFDEDICIDYENINYNKQINTIKWNINDDIHINYKNLDLFEILYDALQKLDKDYEQCTLIINDLIKKYHSQLDKNMLKEFYYKYKHATQIFIENYIRCINY